MWDEKQKNVTKKNLTLTFVVVTHSKYNNKPKDYWHQFNLFKQTDFHK